MLEHQITIVHVSLSNVIFSFVVQGEAGTSGRVFRQTITHFLGRGRGWSGPSGGGNLGGGGGGLSRGCWSVRESVGLSMELILSRSVDPPGVLTYWGFCACKGY